MPKLVVPGLQPTQPQDQRSLPHSLSKATEVTQVIPNNKDMGFTVTKLVANMAPWEVLAVTKPADKATKIANTEVIKLSGATIMATASNVEDGAAITDTNSATL